MKIANSTNYINSVNNSKNKYNALNPSDIDKKNVQDSKNVDMAFFEDAAVDYEQMTKLALENLNKSYKNIDVYISDANGNVDVKKLALGMGKGKHIVISREFLDKMSSDAQSYANGKKILEETFRQVSNNEFSKSSGAYIEKDKISFWNIHEKKEPANVIGLPKSNQDSILDPIKQMQDYGNRLKEKFKAMKKSKDSMDAPASVYTRLAKSRNIPEVRNVVSSAKFKINMLRVSLRSCEDDEKAKIKAMIKQLEKAVVRGYKKIRALSEEEFLGNDKKLLKNRDSQSKRLEEYRETELARRKTIRKIRERAQIDEGNPMYYYPQMFMNKKNKDFEKPPVPTIDAAAISAVQVPAAASMPAITAADVSVVTVEISM